MTTQHGFEAGVNSVLPLPSSGHMFDKHSVNLLLLQSLVLECDLISSPLLRRDAFVVDTASSLCPVAFTKFGSQIAIRRAIGPQ